MWQCVHSTSRTPFPPMTWACVALQGIFLGPNCKRSLSLGDPGGLMPQCICGPVIPRRSTVLIELSRLESPVGSLVMAVAEGVVCALNFAETEASLYPWIQKFYPESRIARRADSLRANEQLAAYFAGELHALEEIPISLNGTAFQKQVWEALCDVGVGQTCSYADLAKAIGRPTAVRAVGAANGQNPIPLVVPCHRVIASDGTLCGYGGGLWRKEWLLRHERAL